MICPRRECGALVFWRCNMKIRIRVLLVGLAIVVLQFASPAINGAIAATLPKDPCALLKPAEIQAAIEPGANIGIGVPSTDPAAFTIGCAYTWGPTTNEWGQTSLTTNVIDASKVFPGGLNPDGIKERVQVETQMGGADASQIPGVGDGAVFTNDSKSHNATLKAYIVEAKGVLLLVQFHGGNAVALKDKLITLLKTAATRL
jgi:hypothetical protein